MFETTGFLISLAATVVAVVLTLIAGLRRRRRRHIGLALTTVVLLGLTVVLAYLMAGVRVFPDRQMAVHRVFSTAVALLVPCVAVTGVLLARRPTWRWPHRACVGAFLVVALGAAITGVWALLGSTPR